MTVRSEPSETVSGFSLRGKGDDESLAEQYAFKVVELRILRTARAR
jgi:hypothetical protein